MMQAIERNERELDGVLRKSEALRRAILHRAFIGLPALELLSDELASAGRACLRAKRLDGSQQTIERRRATVT